MRRLHDALRRPVVPSSPRSRARSPYELAQCRRRKTERTTGSVVASRYKLLAVIGRGPHGVVWSVRDVGTGQLLALKLLEPRVARAPGVRERFRRERGVLTAFLTPTILRVLEMIEADESIGLLTEPVRSQDLRRHLDQPGVFAVNPVTVPGNCPRRSRSRTRPALCTVE